MVSFALRSATVSMSFVSAALIPFWRCRLRSVSNESGNIIMFAAPTLARSILGTRAATGGGCLSKNAPARQWRDLSASVRQGHCQWKARLARSSCGLARKLTHGLFGDAIAAHQPHDGLSETFVEGRFKTVKLNARILHCPLPQSPDLRLPI